MGIYQAKAKPGRSAFSVAIADYMNLPWIESIDTSGYAGNPGDPVRVFACDHFRVTRVTVTLKDPSGQVIENGECQPAPEGTTWLCTATIPMGSALAGSTVTAVVYDLPGHLAEMTVTL
ncbi:MAG: hypothetical protein NTU98_01695 [Bacteroidetes bacterium]|nr:hypothetical protein [Bacteroidota bacterium]